MLFQKIARQLNTICLLTAVAAVPSFADSPVVNSDMMMSGPSAEPMHLTIKHPKNTPMHVTIVTDEKAGGAVEFSAPTNGAPIIAYAFPMEATRNVKVYDGLGQQVWSLVGGEVSGHPAAAYGADNSQALLTQLDRAYSVKPAALEGFYALKMRGDSEFYSTTDIARVNPAGTQRRWAHHRAPAGLPARDNASVETTIVISPSAYVSAPSNASTPLF